MAGKASQRAPVAEGRHDAPTRCHAGQHRETRRAIRRIVRDVSGPASLPPVEVVLVAAILAIAIAVGILSWRAERRHQEALQQLAERLGFRFDPGPDKAHDGCYEQFEIFRRGHSRAAIYTMTGSLEILGRRCAARCGDFRYKVTRKSGKSSSTTTYRFSYLIVHLPWQTPPLLIRPEGIFDKIAGAFGFDDIDFESAEFSRRFYVKSTDKRFAYAVIHPRMMEFLMREQPPMLDIEGGAICCSDGQRRWQPADYELRIAFLRQFLEHWPRHLQRDLEAAWKS